MTAKVVTLRGETIYTPEANAEMVATLDIWRECAASGELDGLAIGVVYRDGSIGHSFRGLPSRTLIGTLFSLMHNIERQMSGE